MTIEELGHLQKNGLPLIRIEEEGKPMRMVEIALMPFELKLLENQNHDPTNADGLIDADIWFFKNKVVRVSECESMTRGDIKEELKQKIDFEWELYQVKVLEGQIEKAKEIMTKYEKAYIEKFLLIAETKVFLSDQYGDEVKDNVALENEVSYVINKIIKLENLEANEKREANEFDFAVVEKIREYLIERLNDYHRENTILKMSNPDFENMTGSDFEVYVCKILEKKGFIVSLNGKTGDQGADIITEKDGKRIIVQAKCYSGSVGNSAIQEVIGAVGFYNGDEGWVITNSHFTKSAHSLAQKNNVTLIDGSKLQRFDKFFH